MNTDSLVREIIRLVTPVIEELQLELVEVQFKRESGGQVLRLIVDSETGLGVDHCAQVSREVGHLLEVEDLIDRPFRLEVSSPGLDRPLKTERDFRRCQGRKINIMTIHAGVSQKLTGVVKDCENEILMLDTGEKQLHIPIVEIEKAIQVIEF